MRFSVCIPAYEMHGRGAAFLARSLAALDRQTLRDFEVIVSDHSHDAVLENLCRRRRQFYPFRYMRSGAERGNSSANTNFAMRHAQGDVVKIINQDDFLFADDALERMDVALLAAPDRVWGGVGCIHVNETETHLYGPHHPRMDPMMLGGNNRFGAPSVMFVRRENVLPFDEALIWVNDCELYHRLHATWGEPILIDELLVAVRQWGGTVTQRLKGDPRIAREIDYALRKHGAATPPHGAHIFGDYWPGTAALNWMGREVRIVTLGKPALLKITAEGRPPGSGPARFTLQRGPDVEHYAFGEKSEFLFPLQGDADATIRSDSTFIPERLIYNGDTRALTLNIGFLPDDRA